MRKCEPQPCLPDINVQVEKYIEKKYTNSNIDVEIPTTERDNVIITSLRVVRLAEKGIHIPFYNILEMKNILLRDIKT